MAEDVPPASLTFFGLYGSPVQPLGLAAAVTNGFGFNILGEWNPSRYASLGLSFEQVTFDSGAGFTYPALNFEGRVFPFQNGKDKFSPYIYGGAGLGLSDGSWPQLKAGLGSRISFIGPVFFDLAVGSHWIQSPGNFQYVDLRAGLSYSIGFKEEPSKPVPSPTAVPTPAVVTSPTPSPTSAPPALETAAPPPSPTVTPAITPLVTPLPAMTLAQGRRYYRLGIKAYGVENFRQSLMYLKRALALRAKRKRASYYAQAYAYMGKIYQFHAHKVKDHLQKALDSYRNALVIDPRNKIARRYYRKLKAQVTRMAKPKRVVTPVPTSEPAPSTPLAPTTGSSPPAQAITLSN